ncbi:STAS domain-containing protein [Streptomyces sp. NPDC014684]|uniref:STAS domain-containing protein n=1 Tax=Streptomyces sp. NPDC014684 TaxID=3364880 RepID=UPI00370310CE
MHDLSEQARPLRTGLPCQGSGKKPLPSGRAGMAYAMCGDRMRVTVRGELDLDSGEGLREDLEAVLAGSTSGVDLDLGGLDFCDCAGLNVLLDLRRCALEQGKTVVIRASTPVVDRLLTLLGAQGLFAPTSPQSGELVAMRLPSPCTGSRVLAPTGT